MEALSASENTCCHLNEIRPTIRFTIEEERDGALPFLDTLLKRNEDGRLNISIYRKSTHTDRYLHFKSHHLIHVKRGVVRCLHERARRIVSTERNLKKEMNHLSRVLMHNGYPSNFRRTSSVPVTQKECLTPNKEDEEKESQPLMVIPYVAGLIK